MLMRLSTHFTLMEAMKSQDALRLGIDNTPPDDIIPELMHTAQKILEPVRAKFGKPITPSSWYRCPELNKAIRGSATSQHMSGQAVDFEVPGVPNPEVAEYIVQNLMFDQVILEYYNGVHPNSGWVHASVKRLGMNRREALTFDGKSYKPGLVY